MDALMSTPDQHSRKPGFVGENPNWGLTCLAGFAIVAIVLSSIILIFR